MFGEIATWLGGGLAVVILYVLISNTLWLLFGSRLLQFLPGVNINGFRGTLKIAVMLVLSVIGVFRWIVKYSSKLVARKDPTPILSEEISMSIRQGAKIFRSENNSKHKA
jgi:hypothetical protein